MVMVMTKIVFLAIVALALVVAPSMSVKMYTNKSAEVDTISVNYRIKSGIETVNLLVMVTITIVLPISTVLLFHIPNYKMSIVAQMVLCVTSIIVLLLGSFTMENTGTIAITYTKLNVIFLGIGVAHVMMALAAKRWKSIGRSLIVALHLHAAAHLLGATLAGIMGNVALNCLAFALLLCLIIRLYVLYKYAWTLAKGALFTISVLPLVPVAILLVASYMVSQSGIPGILLGMLLSTQVPKIAIVPSWYREKLNELLPVGVVLYGVQSIMIGKGLNDTIRLTTSFVLQITTDAVIYILKETDLRVLQSKTELLDFLLVCSSTFSVLSLIEPSNPFNAL